jgi:hypothetical protein
MGVSFFLSSENVVELDGGYFAQHCKWTKICLKILKHHKIYQYVTTCQSYIYFNKYRKKIEEVTVPIYDMKLPNEE